jgi:hypothetical protein
MGKGDKKNGGEQKERVDHDLSEGFLCIWEVFENKIVILFIHAHLERVIYERNNRLQNCEACPFLILEVDNSAFVTWPL